MTDTIREQCLVALVARLATMAGVQVSRNSDIDMARDAMPAVVLFEGNLGAILDNQYTTIYRQAVEVDCYVKAANSDLLGSAVSDLFGKVTLAVLGDPSMGGVAVNLEPQPDFCSAPIIDRTPGRAATAAFTLGFVIQFHTKANDPYIQG
ncbi:MAG: hypothetical protein WBK91_04100 [Alphaproteobacteria bacterium]